MILHPDILVRLGRERSTDLYEQRQRDRFAAPLRVPMWWTRGVFVRRRPSGVCCPAAV